MDKKKKYLIGIIVSFAVAFALIPLAMLLTGNKAFGEYTAADRAVFFGFCGAEGVAITVALIFTGEYTRAKRNGQPPAPPPLSAQEAVLRKRGLALLGVSFATAVLLFTIGVLAGKHWENWDRKTMYVITISFCAVPPLFYLLSYLLCKRFAKSLDKMRVDEVQRFLLSQKEAGVETARKNLAFLKKWRILTGAYAVLLALLGAAIAVCGGWCADTAIQVLFVLYANALFLAALARIRFHIPTAFMEDDRSYVQKQDYPHLYAMAERAARESGCETPVRISFITDGNIGVGDLGTTISLQIDALLLSILSEQELASILNHEFVHVAISKENKEDAYANWLRCGKPRHAHSRFTDPLFAYPDSIYDFRYYLYRIAVSVTQEATADLAMVRGCDKSVAGSALLKTYYADRYEYEFGTYDLPPFYESPTPAPDVLRSKIEDFLRRAAVRAEVWNALIPKQILAQNATHPTLKMRLDALGVKEYRALPGTGSEPFEQERNKAVSYLDQLILDARAENYEKLREIYYIKPLARVEAWEAAGKPLDMQEYRDTVTDLENLGSYAEAETLCERAIRELPDSASHFAYFTRGRQRLHRYEESGLDDLYHAIANNENYVNEALDEIGKFCCITGNQAELERYRGRAVELLQKEKDEHSQINMLRRGDRLSAEHLPDGALEDVLAYIRTIDNGEIRRIYLVRKTVTETYFTSAFVVRFTEDSDPDAQRSILHKIFLYLDTVSDWQYSLFDYREVEKVRIEDVPGSLVYEKQA